MASPVIYGRRRRLLVGLGLALVLCGLGALPLARHIDPRLAVVAAARQPGAITWQQTQGQGEGDRRGHCEQLDPWGQPLVAVKRFLGTVGAGAISWPAYGDVETYSIGPDGRDDGGQGDDVVPTDADRRGLEPFLRAGSLTLVGLLCLWFVFGAYATTPRTRQLRVEVLRAGAFSLGLAFCLRGFVGLVVGSSDARSLYDAMQATSTTLPPAWLGAVGGYLLLCYVVALAWRLNRPLEEDAA